MDQRTCHGSPENRYHLSIGVMPGFLLLMSLAVLTLAKCRHFRTTRWEASPLIVPFIENFPSSKQASSAISNHQSTVVFPCDFRARPGFPLFSISCGCCATGKLGQCRIKVNTLNCK